MPACPACGTALETIRQREGLYFECPSCHGRAITFPQIRRVAGDRYTTSLLRQINANDNSAGRGCPFCTRSMRRFESKEPPLVLDACKTCGVVWFDPAEFNAVPEGAIESPDAARLRGIEAEATSGVIVFYALQFPKAKIGHVVRFGFYFRWIQMPAWVLLILWLLMQGFILMLQLKGRSHVGATAHLGGALAGVLLWLRWRSIQDKVSPETK
jgi:Zn-finger nucleic acid-binding protein